MVWSLIKKGWNWYLDTEMGPSNTFGKCMEFVLKWEGGYINDPKDPGGETKFGVSKKAHPNEDIKNLTKERAKEIYRSKYWVASGADTKEWPECLCLFDAAVNCGVSRAKKWISLNGTAKQRAAYSVAQREQYYRDLVRKRPTLKKFEKGWFNRTNDLRKVAGL